MNSTLYVGTLGVLLSCALGFSPRQVVAGLAAKDEVRRRAWLVFRPAVPLLVGTLTAYMAQYYYIVGLNPGANRSGCTSQEPCVGAVDQEYFAQLSQVIPLVLVALGVEARFFQTMLESATTRAMAVFTVGLLCVAEVAALSALPQPNSGEGELLAPAHELAAFLLTVEASVTGLSILISVLVDPRRSGSRLSREGS